MTWISPVLEFLGKMADGAIQLFRDKKNRRAMMEAQVLANWAAVQSDLKELERDI